MPGTLSSAATKCISEVPGLVKQTFTPPASSVRTRLSAPFIGAPMAFNGSVSRIDLDGGCPKPAGTWPPACAAIASFLARWQEKRPHLRICCCRQARRKFAASGRQNSERAQPEAEGLRLVERLLDDGIGVICPERTKRGVPEQTDAHGGARSEGIAGEPGQRGSRLVDAPQRAGIGEHGAAQPEILWHPRDLEQQLGAGCDVHAPTQGILIGAQDIARSETGEGEATHGFATAVEEIEQAHILTTPAADHATRDAAGRRD